MPGMRQKAFEPEGFVQNMEGLSSTHGQSDGEYEDNALDLLFSP